jgi:hypothetical protein
VGGNSRGSLESDGEAMEAVDNDAIDLSSLSLSVRHQVLLLGVSGYYGITVQYHPIIIVH